MDHSTISRSQAAVADDMEVVRGYTDDHPEDYGDRGWVNEPQVRIVVWFADNVEAHQHVLKGLLPHPECLEVRRSRYTQAHLHAVRDDVQALAYDTRTLRHGGTRTDEVRYTLAATGEAVAAELHRRHGDVLRLTVGVLPYPPRIDVPPPRIEGPPPTDSDLPLDLELLLDPSTLPAGSDGSGVLRLTNAGVEPLSLTSGRLIGWVYRAGGTDPVSVGSGDGPQPAYRLELAPGESVARLPVQYWTASYDPVVGYGLEAGSYEVMTVLHFRTDGAGERYIRSGRGPLELS